MGHATQSRLLMRHHAFEKYFYCFPSTFCLTAEELSHDWLVKVLTHTPGSHSLFKVSVTLLHFILLGKYVLNAISEHYCMTGAVEGNHRISPRALSWLHWEGEEP